MKLPLNSPIAYGSLTKEQFDLEIQKGYDSINSGKTYTADEVEEEMSREFGI